MTWWIHGRCRIRGCNLFCILVKNMGTTKQDQERVRALLKEAITVLCKNGLQYRAKFSIEGLLGITLDDEEVFLVSIHEKVGEEVSRILQQKVLPPPASPLSRTAGSSGSSQPSHSAPASPRTPGSRKTPKKSTVLPVTVNLDQEDSDNSIDSMGQTVLDTPSGHSQPLPGSVASPSGQSSSNVDHNNQRKRPRDSTAPSNGSDQQQNFGSLQLSVEDIPGEGAARSGDDADTGTRLQSENTEHSAKRRALDSSHTQSSAESDILSNIEVKQEIEEDEEDLIFVKEEANQNPPSCQLATSHSSSSEMMLGGVHFSDTDQPGPSHWDPLGGPPPHNFPGGQLGSSPAQDSQLDLLGMLTSPNPLMPYGGPEHGHTIIKNPNKHPCGKGRMLDCVVCSNRAKRRHRTAYMCKECRVPMCEHPCFTIYHTISKDRKIDCYDYPGFHEKMTL